MFKLYSSNSADRRRRDLDELARLSEGFSGSDIRDVCQSAQLKLIGEFFESGKAMDKEAKPRALTMADFRQILEERKPSVSLDMLTAYNRWFEAFKALLMEGKNKTEKMGWVERFGDLYFLRSPFSPSNYLQTPQPNKIFFERTI